MTIYHLARAEDWAAAAESGEYRVSTIGRTLSEVGFIHTSRVDQLTGVAERFYRNEPGDLVVLEIDEGGLDVRSEDDGLGESFPHVYGVIPVASVVRVLSAWFDDDGRFRREHDTFSDGQN
ncbi:MAG: DUF952 domain-containing protein [Salinibacterium sp.]|nr:DUF952 domain-containing protein [Salinibacterium sp.]